MPKLKHYDYLIFDADHTLIDFYEDERGAFRRTFDRFGGNYDDDVIEQARRLSDDAWARAGLNDVHLESVQKIFHTRYYTHLPGLIDRVKEVVPMSASSEEIADFFVNELFARSVILGNSLAIFKQLSTRYKTCIATNGIAAMQRSRLSDFMPYTHALFISEEIGYIKPNPKFFIEMTKELHTDVKNCLFIGDSISSDIAGCAAVGMDCVWVNTFRQPTPTLPMVAKIDSVSELIDLLV